MNKAYFAKSFSALALMAGLATAQAGTPVVDTGAVTAPSGFPLALDGSNWIAGEFSVPYALTIESVKGWMSDLGYGGGSFTVALYDNQAGLPGNLLYSAAGAFSTVSGVPGWNGASGLMWGVAKGEYWVAFEVAATDTFQGVAPIIAPQPLLAYAFNDGGFAGYRSTPDAFGVQVVAVPEPETYALMLAGLGLVSLLARRRQAA